MSGDSELALRRKAVTVLVGGLGLVVTGTGCSIASVIFADGMTVVHWQTKCGSTRLYCSRSRRHDDKVTASESGSSESCRGIVDPPELECDCHWCYRQSWHGGDSIFDTFSLQ